MRTLKLIAVAFFLTACAYLVIGEDTPAVHETPPTTRTGSSQQQLEKDQRSLPAALSKRTYELVFDESFDGNLPTSAHRRLVEHRYIALAEHPLQQTSTTNNFNQALRVTYQGSDRGSERVVRGVTLDAKGDDMVLSFDVTFCEGFDFARGGKLHGLGPRNPVTGGNEMTPEGWSVRLMWRQQGRLQTYVYHHDKPGRFGDTKSAGDFRFSPGQNHHIQLRTRLNTPGEPDGFAQVWVDGNLLIEHDKLKLRQRMTDNSSIRQLLFSTFHGGSSPEWAPRDEEGEYKTDCAYFDNFRIRKFAGSDV